MVKHLPTEIVPYLFYASEIGIIFCCLYFLWKERENLFGLNAIFNTFYLYFFGIAPLIHFHYNTSFYNGRKLLVYEYATVSIIFLFIVFLYNILFFFFKKKNYHFPISFPKNFIKIKHTEFILLFTVLICFGIKVLLQYFGIVNFFNRASHESEITNSFLSLFLKYIKPLIIIFPITVVSYILNKNIKLSLFSTIVIVLVAVYNAFPTSIPRSLIASIYLPIVVIIFPWLFSVKRFFVFFSVTLIYFFPFFNQFRKHKIGSDIDFSLQLNHFNQGHFDNFYNFALTYYDVPITYGKQLLAALLFFVPRNLWETKPTGSGHYLATIVNFKFTNVSENFFAEGYVNFGLLGILLFVIVYAFVTFSLDKKGIDSFSKKSMFSVFYLQLIFLSFYLMRGDLISSYSSIFNFVIVNIFIYILIISNKKPINY